MESAKCTHIFVYQHLSASKTQSVLTRKVNKVKYVTPTWAVESLRAGRRLREANFAAPVFSQVSLSLPVCCVSTT